MHLLCCLTVSDLLDHSFQSIPAFFQRSGYVIWLCLSFKGKTLSDINHSRILYDPPPRAMEIKAKINKGDLMKLKSLFTTKETISKVERQPSEWEKIISNQATDKEVISKIYKQLLQLNSRTINEPINKWAKKLNRYFSKEDIQMAKKHMKRCSTSLIIREMQIKTTMRNHLTPVRQPSSKSLQTINTGEVVEKRECSCTVNGNVNWYSHYERQYGDSLKN